METMFYLGASTPKGFCSHFDSIFDEVRRVTVIKGGCGCGKSTFMRRLAHAARQLGLDVSYILCSSDPDSLDGVIIPHLSCAYVDGTAPHVVEPKVCGGTVNYLNFGEFYRREAMAQQEGGVLREKAENTRQYAHVTACLAAADRLSDSRRLVTSSPAYEEKCSAIAACLTLSHLKPREGTGRVSRRFLSAVTPKGLQLCQKTPGALCSRVYVFRDNYALAPRILARVMEAAVRLGHDCIACHCPLQPECQPTHLLIPTADIAFISEDRDLPYTEECFCRMDLDALIPREQRRELAFCQKTVSALLYQAAAHMRLAKEHHDRMEALCRPCVDFSAADALTEKTIGEIFGEK